MIAKRERQHKNSHDHRREVENRRHEPEHQKSLVIAFQIAYGMDLHLHGVRHLGGKQFTPRSRKHGTNFLGREHIGEVVLPAGIHGYHGSFQAEGPAFQVIREHDKSLDVATDNRMFALTHIGANHLDIEYGARPQFRLEFVGQLAVVLDDNPDRHVLHNLRREHAHRKERHADRQHHENHPQHDVVAEINLPYSF